MPHIARTAITAAHIAEAASYPADSKLPVSAEMLLDAIAGSEDWDARTAILNAAISVEIVAATKSPRNTNLRERLRHILRIFDSVAWW
jgi:hypothetical protein